jgi:hypothetical protein
MCLRSWTLHRSEHSNLRLNLWCLTTEQSHWHTHLKPLLSTFFLFFPLLYPYFVSSNVHDLGPFKMAAGRNIGFGKEMCLWYGLIVPPRPAPARNSPRTRSPNDRPPDHRPRLPHQPRPLVLPTPTLRMFWVWFVRGGWWVVTLMVYRK